MALQTQLKGKSFKEKSFFNSLLIQSFPDFAIHGFFPNLPATQAKFPLLEHSRSCCKS